MHTPKIVLEVQISRERQAELGVACWPVWEKGVSRFSWHYDSPEICYLLEGEVLVTPTDGSPVTIRAGDLALFPAGLSCEWNIVRSLRKHYRLG
jgi:uncharacterized cupin superfamily protein